MEKYETGKLYIVKPSIVISDESKKINHNIKSDETKYEHIVLFENNSKDIGIAISKTNYSYNSLFYNRKYYKEMNNHCLEGDYYTGIFEDDIMLLARYLYIQSVSNPNWSKELEKYIISLKPYYDYEELTKIYEQIKETEESVKTKTLTNIYNLHYGSRK